MYSSFCIFFFLVFDRVALPGLFVHICYMPFVVVVVLTSGLDRLFVQCLRFHQTKNESTNIGFDFSQTMLLLLVFRFGVGRDELGPIYLALERAAAAAAAVTCMFLSSTTCSSACSHNTSSATFALTPLAKIKKYDANHKKKREQKKKEIKKDSRQNSLTLNLHIRAQRQLLNSHTRPRGLDISPVRLIGFVHGREVLHVRQENVDFENRVEAAAGGGEDGGEVADALVLFG